MRIRISGQTLRRERLRTFIGSQFCVNTQELNSHRGYFNGLSTRHDVRAEHSSGWTATQPGLGCEPFMNGSGSDITVIARWAHTMWRGISFLSMALRPDFALISNAPQSALDWHTRTQ